MLVAKSVSGLFRLSYCFGCASSTVEHCITLLRALATNTSLRHYLCQQVGVGTVDGDFHSNGVSKAQLPLVRLLIQLHSAYISMMQCMSVCTLVWQKHSITD